MIYFSLFKDSNPFKCIPQFSFTYPRERAETCPGSRLNRRYRATDCSGYRLDLRLGATDRTRCRLDRRYRATDCPRYHWDLRYRATDQTRGGSENCMNTTLLPALGRTNRVKIMVRLKERELEKEDNFSELCQRLFAEQQFYIMNTEKLSFQIIVH